MYGDKPARTDPSGSAAGVAVADYGYIDVNAQFGPATGRAAGAPLERLLAERRSHGIRLSLVRSRAATLGDTRTGNRHLLEACETQPGLLPVAVLAPERSSSPEEATAIGSRVAAFWLEGDARPGRWSRAAELLAAAAARAGKPLFVPIERFGDASAVGGATSGLGVPVVLVGTHYKNVVDALAAARRYPHLYLETSSMAHLGAIETAVRSIGADRILLGTGAPVRAIQSSLNAIALARVSDQDKVAILAGNAAQLLGLERPAVELPVVRRPKRAIDVHAHLGPMPQDVPDLANDAFVAELARQAGIQVAIASSVEAIETDSEAGNRLMVEACRFDSRLLGYLVADPNDPEAARDHIRRWGDAPGVVGIKIGCEQSQPTASAAIWELFKVLGDYGKPVKIHNDGAGWDAALLRIARAHPKVPIIIAHGGLGSPSLEGAALTQAADNVYFEMCSSFANLSTVREVVRRVPPHKFMFGTDAPLLEPGFVLGTYQDADIPADREDAVYYENAAHLFGIG
jgi:uncharacterized protein